MNEDETEPVGKPRFTENLAIMSIDALNEYVDSLEQEIVENFYEANGITARILLMEEKRDKTRYRS